jgi:hypothetical protein
MTLQDLPHCSVRAPNECRRLPPMHSRVRMASAVPQDHGLVMVDALDKFTVCCERSRTLFHSIKNQWNAMLSMVDQVQGENSRLTNKPRSFVLLTLLSCKSMVLLPMRYDRCDDSGPSTRLFSMETEARGASRNTSRHRYHAAVQKSFHRSP